MRDIKFRVYSTVTGSFDFVGIKDLVLTDNNISSKAYDDDLTVMQFTGLQDELGVDIYEGDVLSREKNCMFHDGRVNEEVSFSGCAFTSGDACLRNIVDSFGAKIIGNIHQNPELLKGQQ